MTAPPSDEVQVEHDPEAEQFRVRDGAHVAILQYRRRKSRIHFMHTEVPEAMRGKGIADILARTALDYARAENLVVFPHCPFVAAFIGRHPEYQPLVQS